MYSKDEILGYEWFIPISQYDDEEKSVVIISDDYLKCVDRMREFWGELYDRILYPSLDCEVTLIHHLDFGFTERTDRGLPC